MGMYVDEARGEDTSGGIEGLDGLEVSSVELGAKLSVKLADWASLDYVLSAKYLPQIVDEWQVANGVTVTIGYDLI